MQEADCSLQITDKKIGNVLRGIAALGVMLGHLTYMLPWYIHRLFPGELFVGLFFFFSGYGLYVSLTKKDYLSGFLKKKIVKIYLPFLLAESVYTILILSTKQEFTLSSFILGSLGIRLYNKVLWYVVELLLINILFFFISKFATRLPKRRIIVTWIILYSFFLLIDVALDIDTCWYLSTSAFLIGVVAALDKAVLKVLTIGSGGAICALFIVGYCGLCFITNIKNAPPSYIPINLLVTAIELFLVPLFVLSVAFLVQHINVPHGIKSLLSSIGFISYEIYLWHIPVFFVMKSFISNSYLLILSTILLTIVLSSLFRFKQLKAFINNGNN